MSAHASLIQSEEIIQADSEIEVRPIELQTFAEYEEYTVVGTYSLKHLPSTILQVDENIIYPGQTPTKVFEKITDRTDGVFGYLATIVVALRYFLNKAKFLLAVVPPLCNIATGLSLVCNLIKSVIPVYKPHESTLVRVIKGIGGLCGVGLCIASLAIPGCAGILLFISFGTELVSNVSNVAALISSRTRVNGKWHQDRLRLKQYFKKFDTELSHESERKIAILDKYRKDPNIKLTPEEYRLARRIIHLDNKITRRHNNERLMRGQLADKVHSLIYGICSHVGAILSVPFPALGYALLGLTAIYGILDKFNLNPLKLLADKIFDHPFAPKPHHASIAAIKARAFKLKEKKQQNLEKFFLLGKQMHKAKQLQQTKKDFKVHPVKLAQFSIYAKSNLPRLLSAPNLTSAPICTSTHKRTP